MFGLMLGSWDGCLDWCWGVGMANYSLLSSNITKVSNYSLLSTKVCNYSLLSITHFCRNIYIIVIFSALLLCTLLKSLTLNYITIYLYFYFLSFIYKQIIFIFHLNYIFQSLLGRNIS
jgi:hypothetical protein